MNKQDRNTAITIAIVLLVCVVALVAVGSALWRTIRPGVEEALSFVGIYIGSTTTNYNFDVPGQSTQQTPTNPNPPATPADDGTDAPSNPTSSKFPNYNFVTTAGSVPEIPPIHFNVKDGMLADFNRAGYDENHLSDSRLTIEIPRIQFSSKVQVKLPADAALQNGLAFFPTSKKHNEGEVVLGCYRRYLPPEDARSCWNLDTLATGDELYVIDNGAETKYTIVGVGDFAAGSEQVYASTGDSNEYLRIVTAHPIVGLSRRLVVLAKRDTSSV